MKKAMGLILGMLLVAGGASAADKILGRLGGGGGTVTVVETPENITMVGTTGVFDENVYQAMTISNVVGATTLGDFQAAIAAPGPTTRGASSPGMTGSRAR